MYRFAGIPTTSPPKPEALCTVWCEFAFSLSPRTASLEPCRSCNAFRAHRLPFSYRAALSHRAYNSPSRYLSNPARHADVLSALRSLKLSVITVISPINGLARALRRHGRAASIPRRQPRTDPPSLPPSTPGTAANERTDAASPDVYRDIHSSRRGTPPNLQPTPFPLPLTTVCRVERGETGLRDETAQFDET